MQGRATRQFYLVRRQFEGKGKAGLLATDLTVGLGEQAVELEGLAAHMLRGVRLDLVSSLPGLVDQVDQGCDDFLRLLTTLHVVGSDAVGPEADVVALVPPGQRLPAGRIDAPAQGSIEVGQDLADIHVQMGNSLVLEILRTVGCDCDL